MSNNDAPLPTPHITSLPQPPPLNSESQTSNTNPSLDTIFGDTLTPALINDSAPPSCTLVPRSSICSDPSTSHANALAQARQQRGKTPSGHTTLDGQAAAALTRAREKKAARRLEMNYEEDSEDDEEWDSYEARERRAWAAGILGSEHRIMAEAERRGDSLAGTRHHFAKIVAGFEDESTLQDDGKKRGGEVKYES